MGIFLKYLSISPLPYDDIFIEIKKEIDSLLRNDFNFENTIFEKYPVELKMIFQSNQTLFWNFWDYCEKKQKENYEKKEDDEIIKDIRKNGIHVIPKYFNAEEVAQLKEDWEISIRNFPKLTQEDEIKTLNNRFNFKTIEKINYVQGSAFDGKKRVIYVDKNTFPNNFRTLLNENQEFKDVIKNYYYTTKAFFPNAIMAEELYVAKYYRDDYYWHIDNLSDQFKVMIILEDMSEDDAPFIYKNTSHKIRNEYKDRYHKMYSINGITTQESNHFEESFTSQNEEAKKAVLKAGDIVLFDCKIHHSASFARNNGKRKNIMIYYNTIPTIKNKILYKIDSYLNFTLR
jgi:ectoine hydroxylase-related dioxygenase (phytanoyl-CoA dioxygenase family)